MAQVIGIANTKGGSGKTTTARELSYHLSQHGRVLAIDLDPLAALTKTFGLEIDAVTHSFASVVRKPNPARLIDVIIYKTPSLAIVAGSRDLSIADAYLKEQPNGAYALRKALEDVKQAFDFVVIDTQGAAGKLIENAIVAADTLLIPFRPQGEDILVLSEFVELLNAASEIRATPIDHIAFLPIGYRGTNQHREAVEVVKDFGYQILAPIKDTTKLGEAATQGLALAEWDKSNPRIEEYAAVTTQVRSWVKT